MTRPLLLDAFCKQGGASMGYHRAGFDVIGIDVEPQPRYPFDIHIGDALTLLPALIERYRPAALAGSPPCPAYCALNVINKGNYPRLVEPTRDLFASTGLPYVIENVPGAPLQSPLRLCGSEFGLAAGRRWLRRHRLFESNIFLVGAGGCSHPKRPAARVYGLVDENGKAKASLADIAAAPTALGIDWMDSEGWADAIPPAYTQFIGEQLLAHVAVGRAA